MIMITTRQAPKPDQQPERRVRRAGPAAHHPTRRMPEHASEYVFATVNGRYEVHIIRHGAGAWAVRLRGFALHPDGCFWPVPDAAPPTGTPPAGAVPGQATLGQATPDRAAPSGAGSGEAGPRSEPTYPLDEAIARALHALVRLP